MSSKPMTRGRLRRRDFLARFAGNSMLAIGGSLFGAAAAYEIYSRRSEAGLSALKRGNIAFPGGLQAPAVANVPAQVAAQPTESDAVAATPESTNTPATAEVPAGAEPALFPATAVATQSANVRPEMLPVKLRIQSIGLMDAKVVEVGTHIEKGQLVWETADHAVGHNIGTAVPGQPGNSVLSGHISSPVRGEGNIFRNLPSLADKIGSRASVQVADGTWHYYDIVGTNVVTPSDIWVLAPTPTPVLTLLTCVPDGVYTHRFVAVGRYAGHS